MASICRLLSCLIMTLLCTSCAITGVEELLNARESPFDIYANENGDYELRSVALIRKQQFIVASSKNGTGPSVVVGNSETKESAEIRIGLFRPILILSESDHIYFVGASARHEESGKRYTPVARISNRLPFTADGIQYVLVNWSERVDFGDVSCDRGGPNNIEDGASDCILAFASFDSRFLTTIRFDDSDFQPLNITDEVQWQENLHKLHSSGAIVNAEETQLEGLSPNSLAISIQDQEVYVSFSDELFLASVDVTESDQSEDKNKSVKTSYHTFKDMGPIDRLQLIEISGKRRAFFASDVDNANIVTFYIGEECKNGFCKISTRSFDSPEQTNKFSTRGLVLPVVNNQSKAVLALEKNRKTLRKYSVSSSGRLLLTGLDRDEKFNDNVISIISDPYSECVAIVTSLAFGKSDTDNFDRARMSVVCL